MSLDNYALLDMVSILINKYETKKEIFHDLNDSYTKLLSNNKILVKIDNNLRSIFNINEIHKNYDQIKIHETELHIDPVSALVDQYVTLKKKYKQDK